MNSNNSHQEGNTGGSLVCWHRRSGTHDIRVARQGRELLSRSTHELRLRLPNAGPQVARGWWLSAGAGLQGSLDV
eukprot:1177273-Rhodomonas_salina.1